MTMYKVSRINRQSLSKRLLSVLFGICLGAICILCGFAQVKKAPVVAKPVAVRAVFDQMVEAAKKQDEKALARFHSAGASYIDGSGFNQGYESYYAKAAQNTAAHASRMDFLQNESVNSSHAGLTDFRVADVKDHTVGDIAWVTYKYGLTAQVGGKATPIIGYATIIFQRSGETWKVEHSQTAGRPVRASDAKF